MSKRKPYNIKAGYIASLRSGINKGWVVIYDAEKASLDNKDGKYAAIETLTDTMEALDVSSYDGKLNDEIANLNAKIDELKAGIEARNKMKTKIKSYARHLEQDITTWKKKQKRDIDCAIKEAKQNAKKND